MLFSPRSLIEGPKALFDNRAWSFDWVVRRRWSLRADLKQLLCVGLYRGGALDLLRRTLVQAARWGVRARTNPVFVIHRLGPDSEFFSSTPLREFEVLVEVLARHYTLLDFEEMARRIHGGSCRPTDACITFDDGYAQTHALADQVLRRYGARATTFIVTSGFEGRGLWVDELAWAIEATECSQLTAPSVAEPMPLATRQQKLKALKTLKIWLRRQPNQLRQRVLSELAESLKVDPASLPEHSRLLSGPEFDELAKHRETWHIGSHSVNHVSLDVESEDSIEEELRVSKQELERRSGRAITTIAYPHGCLNDATIACLKKLGYTAGCTAYVGGNPAGVDPFLVQRTTPYWSSLEQGALGIEREFYRRPGPEVPAGLMD